jgi:CRP-like cAMP-binding protein
MTPADQTIGETVQRLIAKLQHLEPLTSGFGQALTALCTDRVTFARGDVVIGKGDAYRQIYLIERGWAVRYKTLDGGQRQVVNYALASDFLCFNAALFRRSDVAIAAKTQLNVFRLPIRPFRHILSDKPEIALALAWENAQQEAVLAERVASIGRRSAKQRVAHLFCELWTRLDRLGLVEDHHFELPITQEDLADTLGLSLVHANRTLRELSRDGLADFRHGRVELRDLAALAEIAGFDGVYLRHDGKREPSEA